MNVRTLVWALVFPVALAGTSCYPGGPEVAGELDVVATWHNDTTNFKANHTYAMPDTVVDMSVAGGGMSSLTHAYDDTVLAVIAAQMQAYGYTRVDGITTKGDVIVVVGGVSVEHTDVWYPAYPPGGWYGWWGGWPCGYGCYPVYPWVPVATQYTTGSVIISMLDPDAPHGANQIAGTWAAAINGLLTGGDASIKSRVTFLIQQAFIQSPYLKH
ncbi:MAG TPA: DUF4136 domain-containing protein [Gemmatimonadales bacterium]|nr:DUF4136 domain-containing protein [Gemmatimonadales bacterium]